MFPPLPWGGDVAAAPSVFLKVTEAITVTVSTGTGTESATEAVGRTTTATRIVPLRAPACTATLAATALAISS